MYNNYKDAADKHLATFICLNREVIVFSPTFNYSNKCIKNKPPVEAHVLKEKKSRLEKDISSNELDRELSRPFSPPDV